MGARIRRALPPSLLTLVLVACACVAHAGPKVALIGDEHRGAVLREIAAAERSEVRRRGDIYELAVETVGLTLSSLAPGGGILTLANLLLETEIGLIVVDSTRGPTPAIREHVLVARQARVPMLAVLFANVGDLYARAPQEAGELLAIERGEMRDLLSTYDLNGNASLVFYDARPPEATVDVAAHGPRDTLRTLSRFAPRRVPASEMQNAGEIWSAVYLLTEAEADGHAVSLTPEDSVIVWSEGTQSRAKLASVSAYHPGDFREMPLAMEQPLSGREGSRILLVRGDRVVGLGTITQVGH